MHKESLYFLACQIINALLMILGVVLTTIYVPRLVGWHAWWVYVSVALFSFLAWGYLVQWILSAGVNTMLGWLILGHRDAEEDGR